MTKVFNLKLVESYPFYQKEVDLSASSNEELHSLHYCFNYPESSDPAVINYLISNYSAPGQVVFDPFCGSGTVCLESALLGRLPCGSDANPVAIATTEAKLQPADITEVTLKLQVVNLKRPLDLDHYNEYFSPFYDVNTFRELLNLRQYLGNEEDRISRHVKMLACGLLHGSSASYFSVATSANAAFSPREQAEYNQKRRQEPDYRAIIPRIIKKSATGLRDGIPSVLGRCSAKRKLAISDARNLSFMPAGSVDLILSAPPIPDATDVAANQWLENWFLGCSTQEVKQKLYCSTDIDDWLGFMNEVLMELSRIIRVTGKCAFVLNEVCAEQLQVMVNSDLSRFWEADSLIMNKTKQNVIKKSWTDQKRNHFLVLRRK